MKITLRIVPKKAKQTEGKVQLLKANELERKAYCALLVPDMPGGDKQGHILTKEAVAMGAETFAYNGYVLDILHAMYKGTGGPIAKEQAFVFHNEITNYDQFVTKDGIFPCVPGTDNFEIQKSFGIKNPTKKWKKLKDGSWVVGIKVPDEDIWNAIYQNGILKGLSITGIGSFKTKE